MPHFFSDHMVLQRRARGGDLGKADANAEVRVSFKNKTANAKAAADGKWRAKIETGPAMRMAPR